nr:phosphoribosyl-AMP cyclohydrolase [uncultured bacterium]
MSETWLNKVNWAHDGLIPVVVQDVHSHKVLMLAWMNREALKQSITSGEAVFWSRSRKKLWRKGEASGHLQKIREIRLDCDEDAVLLLVEQVGGISCHTGREHCFFQKLEANNWVTVEPVLKDPAEIYPRD